MSPEIVGKSLSALEGGMDSRNLRRYKDPAMRFKQNFAKFTDRTPQEVIDAGPKV